jgi:hypothetical protein
MKRGRVPPSLRDGRLFGLLPGTLFRANFRNRSVVHAKKKSLCVRQVARNSYALPTNCLNTYGRIPPCW